MRITRRTSRTRAGTALLGAAAMLIAAAPVAQAATAQDGATAAPVADGTGTETPALVDGLDEAADADASAPEAARGHLAAKKGRYHIDDPAKSLRTLDSTKTGAAETVRFQQEYKGLEVLGGQYVVRMEKKAGERVVTGTSGQYFTELDTSVTPKVAEDVAVQRAVAAVAKQYGGQLTVKDAGKTNPFTGKDAGLVVLPQGKGVLTRRITVSGTDRSTGEPVLQQVYVDGRSGFPVLSHSSLQTFAGAGQVSAEGTVDQGEAATGDSAEAAAAYPFPGSTGTGVLLDGTTVELGLYYYPSRAQYTMRDYGRMWDAGRGQLTTWDARGREAGSASGVWPSGIKEFGSATPEFGDEFTQAGAVDAHWAAGQVYDYYRGKHDRDSLDGKGMSINSLVGVVNGGRPFVNAFWDGTKMVYGTGDAEYKPMAADLDVVGHEMTHGVVEHTANLVYIGQSGAMNEAVADYFGNAIDLEQSGTSMDDPDSGLLGEDLCRTASPRDCALRDLNDGATTSEDFLGLTASQDNGGVHLNSTIYSGALWDIRQALGAELGDRIVYKALAEYLTPLDGFTAGRQATIAAATALGATKQQLATVEDAFDAHGIVPGWEKDLGVDSDLLVGDLNTYATGAGAGGGRWATSRSNHDGSEPFSVWAGRTDGKGTPELISPNNGNYNVYADTDGKNVAWASFGPQWVDLMVRPVDGGIAKRVYSIGANVSGVRIDGDYLAFEVVDPKTGNQHVGWVNIETGQQGFVDNAAGYLVTALPAVSDGKLAYAKLYPEPDGYKLGVEVLDLATNTKTLMPDAGKLQAVGRPGFSAGRVVWLADEDYDGASAVRSAAPDGTGMADATPDSGAGALYGLDLTASDEAVTVTAYIPDTTYRNATTPKLWQLSVDGRGDPVRVSCARGEQVFAAADEGKRVVWIDGTTGHTDLVTRAKPAGNCAA